MITECEHCKLWFKSTPELTGTIDCMAGWRSDVATHADYCGCCSHV